MNKWIRTVTVVGVVTALPYIVTWAVGCYWLYQRGYLLPYLGVTAAITFFGWQAADRLAKRGAVRARRPPPNNWPTSGVEAWQAVDVLAQRAESNPPALDRLEPPIELLQEVVETVAAHLYPRSTHPALEVTLPDALHCVESVARDLRNEVEQRMIGAHTITLGDLNKVSTRLRILASLYPYYRMMAFGINPLTGVVREAAVPASSAMLNLSQDALRRWAVGYCVRRMGYYAIQLYCGQLELANPEFAALGEDKPLRILVLGQTKAGKSSLINALFGKAIAATDVLPCTDAITPYILEREGLPSAIVFDTVGFAGAGDSDARRALDEEISRCDLVVAVCSATSAAREADRKLLDEARLRLSTQKRRSPPPVFVALSHIDLVRPAHEWNPPYNFDVDDSPKARNIRDAATAVADDLNMPVDRVVPVCLRPEAVYNVEQRLLPAIAVALPEAQRARLLRLLFETRTETEREALKKQLTNTGLTLAKAVAEIAAAVARRL